MSSTDIFADGIGEITLSGGMVRMDLVTLKGTQSNANEKPKLEFSQRVIMPPDGFLRSFSAMENLVKQLIEAGLVKPRDQQTAAGEDVSNGGDSTKSPNF
jgi:hypothetical protein